MARDNETNKVKLARIDERTGAIQGDIVEIKEHLKTQNEKLLTHEGRIASVEQVAVMAKSSADIANKNMHKLLIGLIVAVLATGGGVAAGLLGAW